MSTHENDIEILWLSQNGYYPASRIVPHRPPDYYQIYFTQNGRGQFLLDTETYSFESGMFFLVHPDELHGLSDFSPSEGETVSVFELKFFIHNQNLAEELERIRKPVRETADLSAEFTKIFREAVQKDDFMNSVFRIFLSPGSTASSMSGKTAPAPRTAVIWIP